MLVFGKFSNWIKKLVLVQKSKGLHIRLNTKPNLPIFWYLNQIRLIRTRLMEIRGHLEVKLWIWSGCFGHTSLFQLKNPAQVPPTLQLVDPNIWKLIVSKMIELDWFEIKFYVLSWKSINLASPSWRIREVAFYKFNLI